MREIRLIAKKQIEALIFIAEKPLYPEEIAKLLEMSVDEVEEVLKELKGL